jgi:hypothetical protein
VTILPPPTQVQYIHNDKILHLNTIFIIEEFWIHTASARHAGALDIGDGFNDFYDELFPEYIDKFHRRKLSKNRIDKSIIITVIFHARNPRKCKAAITQTRRLFSFSLFHSFLGIF